MTTADIDEMLAPYVPLVREIIGKNLTLERMVPLMDALGNPQHRLKIIHIAGTSGKTSTAYYTASLIVQAGCKVGLTVSPHVDSVLERVQINMQPLTADEFGAALQECIAVVKKAGIEPTYFELLTALAYWYFAKQNVDYAVIETGLGGLHDGTNVANNRDKVCVITDIGLDHMHVLGNTVTAIARQKAGIIHPGNVAIMYRQSDEIMKVFESWCHDNHAKLIMAQNNTYQGLTLGDLPEFQQRNWLLAQEAYQYLQARDNLPLLTSEKLEASMTTQVPGRMDTVKLDGKIIVMDGAHNEQKVEAFVDSFKTRYPGKKAAVLLGLKEGKELAAVLLLLKPITTKLITTSFASTQDLPARSIDPFELAEAARRFGFNDVTTEPDLQKAYQIFLSETHDVGVVAGSFYLLSQLRNLHPELRRG